MRIALHPDTDYDTPYYTGWIDALQRRRVAYRLVDLLNPGWREALTGCDGLMWRAAHSPFDRQWGPRVLYTLATYLDLPTYPSIADFWHYDEKVSQAYLLAALDLPTPRTWVFSALEPALAWAQTTTYPKVFKLSIGTSSLAVRKVDHAAQAEALIRRMFCRGMHLGEWLEKPPLRARLRRAAARLKRRVLRQPWATPVGHWHWAAAVQVNYVLFQDFLPGNTFDTRITVIGARAFGYRRWNRADDFRASGSGHNDYDPAEIDRACVVAAFGAARALGTRCMAFDFIYDGDQPVITEISWTFVPSYVQRCPGHWTPDLAWVPGHVWPQDAQVDDFLAVIRQRTP